MKRPIVVLCLMCLFGIETQAQLRETFKLEASDAAANQWFGASVALSGEYAVIGAERDSGSGLGSGAAYVFDLTTGQQLRKLTASDARPFEWFGGSVAISGNVSVIGAMSDGGAYAETGAAYVFDVTTGQQLFELKSSDAARHDLFGYSVALWGDLIVIGAVGDDDMGSDSGSAYLFSLSTGQQLHKLTASDGTASDSFGNSVALYGNLALIGAVFDEDLGPRSGSAYLFNVTTGQQLLKLTASDGTWFDHFGSSVALSANFLLIGAWGADDVGDGAGSVYVFDVTTGQQLRKLTASDGLVDDRFGSSVALFGDYAVIGADGDYSWGTGRGAAYVFDVRTGKQKFKLVATDGASGDAFGCSVALFGDLAVVGSVGSDSFGDASGAAYVFTLPIVPYGSGCAGSGGFVPDFAINGIPAAGGLITLEINGAVGGSVAFILQGFAQAAIPIGAGCTLNVAPPISQLNGPFTLEPFHGSGPGIGWLTIPVAIPSSAPPGLTFVSQAFVPDSGVPRGFANTNGVEVTFR